MPVNVARILDEDHRGTLDLLDRVERALARAVDGAAAEAERVSAIARLRAHLIDHVARHFDFEEVELFPRLEALGEGDLCALLAEEHVTIREVIAEIVPLASRMNHLAAHDAKALERAVRELAERLRSHIDKETVALLPACIDGLDDITDQELALRYVAA